MNEARFHLRAARWPEDRERLRVVRETVFVEEQGVPLELEWDGLDGQCLHLLAEDAQGRPIGTGRLLPDGRIGRMAVLKPWRGRGVGSALLRGLMEAGIAQGCKRLMLDAQVGAIPFYERAGFRAAGPCFEEAGIPHRRMYWQACPD